MRVLAARAAVAVAVAAGLVTAGCGSSGGGGAAPGAPTAKPSGAPVAQGQPFVNRGFRIVVTDVALGARLLPNSTAPGVQVTRSAKGQFALVHLRVTNVLTTTQSYDDAANSVLVDQQGRRFHECQCDYTADYSHTGFRQPQAPGATVTGTLAFDVPRTVTAPTQVLVQPQGQNGIDNAPTVVTLRAGAR